MIKLRNVSKDYKTSSELVHVLKNINLDLPDKGLIFILGRSGSGKSTLLKLLGGLEKATYGNVYIDDVDLEKLSAKELANYRNYNIGFVFQNWKLLKNFSVFENVRVALDLQNRSNDELVHKTLGILGVSDLEKRSVRELSGGEQQRVAIARAIVKNPKIILCDEPTGNLDYKTSKDVFNILKKLSEERLVVIVSHDNESAYEYGDKVININDGMIEENFNNFKITEEEKNVRNISLRWSKRLYIAWRMLTKRKIYLVLMFMIVMLFNVLFGFSLIIRIIDQNKIHAETLVENNVNKIRILSSNGFNKQEILNLKQISDYKVSNSFRITADNIPWRLYFENTLGLTDYYRYNGLEGSKYLYSELTNEFEYDIIGDKPSEMNEVLISNFLADYIIEIGLIQEDKVYKPNNYQELLNKTILINSDYIVVSGIYIVGDSISKTDILNNFDRAIIKDEVFHFYINKNFFETSAITRNKFDFINNQILLKNIVIGDIDVNDNLLVDEVILSQTLKNVLTDIDIGDFIELNIGVKNSDELKTVTLKVKAISDKGMFVNSGILSEYILDNKKLEYITVYESDKYKLENLLKLYPIEDDGKIYINSQVQKVFTEFGDFINTIKSVSGYIIILLGFLIMLSYFLYLKITKKNDEEDIFVFYSLGMKQQDIRLMNLINIIILYVLTVASALLVTYVLSIILNNILSNIYFYKINFFSITNMVIVILLGFNLFCGIINSLINRN